MARSAPVRCWAVYITSPSTPLDRTRTLASLQVIDALFAAMVWKRFGGTPPFTESVLRA
jgi:hypothetical protein